MNKQQIAHIVVLIAVVTTLLLTVHLLNLGPAIAQALISLHSGR